MNIPIEAMHFDSNVERKPQPIERTFESIGNYDLRGTSVTRGFSVTGHMPNLDNYLRENNLHPLDHYGVTGVLYKNDAMTVYLYGDPYELQQSQGMRVEILVEIFEGNAVHYYDGQLDIPKNLLVES